MIYWLAARPRAPIARFLVLAILAVAGAAGASCGKKGPPLAPLLRIPAAPGAVSARRLGNTVYVEFTVPAANQDKSTPADVARVQVFGFTGTPASDEDLLKNGTLVATVEVRKPPRPEDDRGGGERTPARAAKIVEPGVEQGATVAVTEALTPELLKAHPASRPAAASTSQPASAAAAEAAKPAAVTGEPGKPVVAVPVPAQASAATVAVPAAEAPLARTYVAVALNGRGRRGGLSQRSAVPVENAPAPPANLKLTYTETHIVLSWSAPDAATAVGAEPVRYNVYQTAPAAASASVPAPGTPPPTPPQTAVPALPKPLNEAPVATAGFEDRRLEFGSERCYVVRTVATAGGLQQESEPSAVACLTPTDVFPPAAPKGLTAVTSAGAINLLWEPNTENDLAGYLVLRGEAPGVTMQPITSAAIRETTYNDRTVQPGVRYVYAIVGVDKTGNIGAQSNKVEETAR